MKRWILAIAVLLGPIVGVVWSDYVVILVDLTRLEESQAKKDKDGNTTGTPLFPGTGGAALGMPGGALGGALGQRGGAGAFGQRGGAGALGQLGGLGQRGGGGAIGMPGPGGFGQMGGAGFPGGAPAEEESTAGHLYAIVYLELKHKAVPFGKYLQIDTEIGKAYVPAELVKGKDEITPSVAKRFRDYKKSFSKSDKLPSAENILSLATWALEHGMLKEFVGQMEDLAKADPKNPAVAAFLKVRKDMQRPLSQAEPASKIGEKLEYREDTTSPHYSLWAPTGIEPARVKRYLAELERTYETFFYWFALKGRALDVPTRRLVAILEQTKAGFDTLHADFGSAPLVADGFLARQDNLAVISAQRTDEAYVTLSKINTTQMSRLKVPLESFLTDKIYKIREVQGQGLNLYGYQTLALMQKAMEEESIRASVSHEAVRQLLASTGLIPRNVGAPEWLRFGLASLLETPQKAFYHSAGIQSWLYLRPFKDLLKEKDREKNEDILLRVLGDHYFHHAHDMLRQVNAVQDDKEARDALGEKADKELEKARCTAWALAYFLSQDRAHREQMENFMHELASLPRDQEFGERALIQCFARSFGLTDPADPTKLSAGKIQKLANTWVGALENAPLDVDIKVEIPKKEPEKKKPAQGGFPGRFGPGGPGGAGGPGGSGTWLGPNDRDLRDRLHNAIRMETFGRREAC